MCVGYCSVFRPNAKHNPCDQGVPASDTTEALFHEDGLATGELEL